MTRRFIPIYLLASIVVLLGTLQSCTTTDKCEEVYTYTTLEPIYVTWDDARAGVAFSEARDLENPGKLYYLNPYLLINERGEGVHIIDNSNKSNPIPVGFLEIPGNIDIAMKGNILYADNYTDLLAIDLSDFSNPVIKERLENVYWENWNTHPDNGIIVDWEDVEHVENYNCAEAPSIGLTPAPWWGWNAFVNVDVAVDFDANVAIPEGSAGAPTAGGVTSTAAGIGGSFARFTLRGNYLYVVTDRRLFAYDISNPSDPNVVSEQWAGWRIETIYPFENTLLIGSENATYIYGLNDPTTPNYISQYWHVRGCDPIVAEGDHAFVTVRTGNACVGDVNELHVLDISNVYEPDLLETYNMTNPHGLGIDDGTLFLCDGDDGLKVYDANDVEAITENQLAHFPNINAFDVIPFDGALLMIGSDGFYQYDYSDLTDLKLLSTIPIVRIIAD